VITYLTLILALSLDTFMAALSYETSKIKIPFKSNLVISLVCSITLIISLFLGNSLSLLIPTAILKWLSFFILFFIGVFKIFDSQVKKCLIKNSFKPKKVNFSFCNLKFILQIYGDYVNADYDKSKTLSVFEAFSLALALSIDGLSAGLAFSSSLDYIFWIFLLCLIINVVFIFLAKVLGMVTKNIKFDFSLIGGFIFIILAFFRL